MMHMSGTMSHLDNSNPPSGASKQSSANVDIYATNYNVLRIMSGMGGVAYSN